MAAGPRHGEGRPARSPASVALGTFLVLAACALLLVIAAGDRAPLWMIGAWFVMALAAALVVGALVPAGAVAGSEGDEGDGADVDATPDADLEADAPGDVDAPADAGAPADDDPRTDGAAPTGTDVH